MISVAPISYQDALTLARSYDGKIIFDNDSYNLHFSYDGDDGAPHKVQFTDAATTFNSMRFAQESELGGVALCGVWEMKIRGCGIFTITT